MTAPSSSARSGRSLGRRRLLVAAVAAALLVGQWYIRFQSTVHERIDPFPAGAPPVVLAGSQDHIGRTRDPFHTVFFQAPPIILVNHRPRQLEKYLSDTSPVRLEGANSVQISPEDWTRAQGARVSPLEPLEVPLGVRSESVLHRHLFNTLKDFVVDAADDAYPYYVDYGSPVGHHFAAQNRNATVVSIRKRGSTKDDTDCRTPLRFPNLVAIDVPGWQDDSFAPWFAACNVASVSFVLQRATPRRYLDEWDAGAALHLVLRALAASRNVYAALLPSEVQDLENTAGSQGQFDPQHFPLDFNGMVEKMHVRVRRLAVLWPDGRQGHATGSEILDDSGAVVLTEVTVIESSRACAKTWGAPLVQWGRKIFVHIRSGGHHLSIQVRSDTARDVEGLGRTIHPLQYIPSVNLDTLLGAGLSEAQRIRFLAHMISTPRYSDPLPHNWIVGLGGLAVRIDKVDARFDKAVDESKSYWGNSTRGYLHLLGYHLCLPISATSGVPKALEHDALSSGCLSSCSACWSCCSYLPKGSEACRHCLRCAACIMEKLSDLASSCSDGRAACQRSYSSMHHARKIWNGWRAADLAADRKSVKKPRTCPAH